MAGDPVTPGRCPRKSARPPDESTERAHRYELDVAEHCAVAHALAHGVVHVGHVVDALVRLGVVEPSRPAGGPRNRWLGLLFRRRAGLWENTGARAVISNRARGSNRHGVVVWRLAEGADPSPFLREPERPAGWSPPGPASGSKGRGEAVDRDVGPASPLPFDPARAAREVEYLEQKGRMRGEAPSGVTEALVAWLRQEAGRQRPAGGP